MSEKTECPGCLAYTSSVRHAFDNGEPCPSCGLSASAAAEVVAVRRRRCDEQTKDELGEALLLIDRRDRELAIARRTIEDVRRAVAFAAEEAGR